MTNHVHLLVTASAQPNLSALMKRFEQRYVQYVNRTYHRTGTLWEGRFRSCLIEAETYFLACQRYVELNPVRAGIVRDPAAYPWSSFHRERRRATRSRDYAPPTLSRVGPDASDEGNRVSDAVYRSARPAWVDSLRACTTVALCSAATASRDRSPPCWDVAHGKARRAGRKTGCRFHVADPAQQARLNHKKIMLLVPTLLKSVVTNIYNNLLILFTSCYSVATKQQPLTGALISLCILDVLPCSTTVGPINGCCCGSRIATRVK